MLIVYPHKFNVTNMFDEDFNKKVMRRVRFVYYAKKITHPLIVEGVVLSFFVFLSANYVSFTNVIYNFFSVNNFRAVGIFWINAFQKTDLPITLTVGTVVISCVFIYQLVIFQSPFFFSKIGRIYRKLFCRHQTPSFELQ